MLSKIIERSSRQDSAATFPLDRVSVFPASLDTAGSTKKPEAPDAPDTVALNLRIAQLEKAVVDTESSAYARGRRDAESEAQQRFAATMQSTAERLAQAVRQLGDVKPRLCKEAETDVLRLAMAIAQRILHRELNVDPAALQALIRVSLDRLGRQDQIRVRVSPSLADAVRASLARFTSRTIEVSADPNLEAGSLLFETSRGQLDASIPSQLDEIERGLIDRLENRHS